MNTISTPLLCVILLLLAACSSDTPQSSTTASAPPSTPDSIYHNGLYLHHQTYGQGTYTLLFVHGWCIDQTYWSGQVEALKEDYQIVTLDLPGFGQSGRNRADWSMQTYGQDINTLIDQLGLKNVILIGHSMGGDVVLEAASNNEQILALIGVDNFKDVGAIPGEEEQAEINGFMALLENDFGGTAAGYAEMALFHPSTDSTDKARVVNSFRNSDPKTSIASLKALFGYVETEARQLSNLKQKLYLINSDATPTDRKGLDATGVTYEVIDIPATGHYPMIEKTDLFNQLLRQTVQKITANHNG